MLGYLETKEALLVRVACVGVFRDKGGIICENSLCSFAMQREQVTVHLPKKDMHGKSQHQKTKRRSRTHQSDPLNPLGQTSVVFGWKACIVCDVCNALLQYPQAMQHDAYDFGEYF